MKNLTVKELRDKAKALNIVGRWDMNKAELISAIELAEKEKNNNVREEEQNNMVDFSKKEEYINNAPLENTLVAYRREDGKVKSAMLIKRNAEKRKVIVETSYGKRDFVKYEDILWVRPNKLGRWPKGVFKELKA